MANGYGTIKYQERKDWYNKIRYKNISKEQYIIEDIEVFVERYEYDTKHQYIEKSKFIFKFNDSKEYKFDVLDQISMKPIIVIKENVRHIFFKKDLYGYFLLNLETYEEINYFPSVVLDNEDEAYIIVDGLQFKDLLILDGCYWGSRYFPIILDLNTLKTINLLDIKKIDEYYSIKQFEIKDDIFIITDDEGAKTTFTYQELKEQLNINGKYDL